MACGVWHVTCDMLHGVVQIVVTVVLLCVPNAPHIPPYHVVINNHNVSHVHVMACRISECVYHVMAWHAMHMHMLYYAMQG